MMKKKHGNVLLSIVGCLLLSACGSYYSRHLTFHKLFINGDIKEADETLARKKRMARGRARLLYYMNRGVTHHLLQEYEESNEFFETAYRIHEDFVSNPISDALSFLINPTITNYEGEDHEVLLINYYKALNYLHLGNLSAALVECRRLNIQINQLSDRYNSPSKYSRDAFIHLLMGVIYQANHEYNDAFIAYRNAVEIYQTDYKNLFGLDVPLQLQKDLIYTAHQLRFYDQVDHYKKTFQLDYNPAHEPTGGDIVCLWNNGLGPYKDQWSVNFVLVKGAGGMVTFVNEELGLFFPFPLPSDGQSNGLSDLHMLRLAFPRYIERPPIYESATIQVNKSTTHTFEEIENINAIAFKVLHERMVWEFSKSLLRVALKKVAEIQLRKQNEILGTLLGVVNFATEQADTRNWQTLPHSIYYMRLRLPPGQHTLTFKPQAIKALSHTPLYACYPTTSTEVPTLATLKTTKNHSPYTFSIQVANHTTQFCTLHTPNSIIHK